MWELAKEFRFEAAHYLPYHTGKCHRLHGHSWRGILHVKTSVLTNGIGIDYADMKAALAPLVKRVDHSLLNESTGLENPTSEEVARWFSERIIIKDAWVTIKETCTTSCIYTPGDSEAIHQWCGVCDDCKVGKTCQEQKRNETDAVMSAKKAYQQAIKAGSFLTDAWAKTRGVRSQHLDDVRADLKVLMGNLSRWIEHRTTTPS